MDGGSGASAPSRTEGDDSYESPWVWLISPHLSPALGLGHGHPHPHPVNLQGAIPQLCAALALRAIRIGSDAAPERVTVAMKWLCLLVVRCRVPEGTDGKQTECGQTMSHLPYITVRLSTNRSANTRPTILTSLVGVGQSTSRVSLSVSTYSRKVLLVALVAVPS